MAAAPPAAGGKKLFGLPRTWAIVAIGSGLLLVAYLWYRNRQAANAQAALPATASVDPNAATTSPSTAAPSLGGTPATDTSSTLSGADLVSAFNAQESLLAGGFASQEQLISQLGSGLLSSEQQFASVTASLVGLLGSGNGGGGGAGGSGGGAGGGGASTGGVGTGSIWGPPAAVSGVPGGFVIVNAKGGVAVTPQVNAALAAAPNNKTLIQKRPSAGFNVTA